MRDVDPGESSVWRSIDGRPPVRLHNCRMDGPRSGIATLHLELPDDLAEGDTLMLDVEVNDISRVDPFVNRLLLDVEHPTSSSPSGRRNPPQSSTNSGRGTHGTTGSLALPEVKRVHEDEWSNHSFHAFTSETALAVVRAGQEDHARDVFDFYVNVHNKYVRAMQKESKEDPRLLEERFVYSMVLVGLALILDHRSDKASRNGDTDTHDEMEGSIEQLVSRVTTKLAPVMLPLVDVVGSLSLDNVDDE